MERQKCPQTHVILVGQGEGGSAKVVVSKSGFLGIGLPVFEGLESDFGPGGRDMGKGKKVIELREGQEVEMWYPFCENGAQDKLINGRWAQRVVVTSKRNIS